MRSPIVRRSATTRRTPTCTPDRADGSRRIATRTRTVRRRADIRDTLHAIRNEITGRAGADSASAALRDNEVQELVLTRCFLERNDADARGLLALAAEHAIEPIVVDGVVALELDLFSGGVAARLRD